VIAIADYLSGMPMIEADNTIRVILADDHAVVRAGIRQFLEYASDIQVVAEAGDGQVVCHQIEEYHPDVVVLDIQMPRMSGIEVTRWVRVHHPGLGVLILSAYDDDPFITAGLKAGANGYVLKTASPEEIVQAVRMVHSGRTALDPGVARKLIDQFATPAPSSAVVPLSEREMEVLTLAGRGYTNKAIAVNLGISDRTVQNHLARIYDKLQAASRTEAVMRAVSLGWLPQSLGKISDD
jgi:DNA-binding NarL/FixJ family response regulator